MAYLAFYRAFRPVSFDGVVRQEHIVRILKNQIATDKVGHAYLFCGPRGTGKTTLAKIFARAINCENPQDGSPCGSCPACKSLAEGGNLDVYEIDAASNNGVDEMRDLREKVQYPPVAGRYKVYIIDEVHMLTASAFNAVLKTLEEPPRHAVFILATTEPQKIPATILSRCMRFDFKLLPQKDLEELVKSVLTRAGKDFEPEAVAQIARAGAGSARDSLSIADMCASYSRGKLTYDDVNSVLGGAEHTVIAQICDAVFKEDASSALSSVEGVLSTGKSVGVLVKDLLSYLNDCTIVKVCKNYKEILNLPEETLNIIKTSAELVNGHKLLRVTEILAKAEADMRYALSERITLETAIYKCSVPQADYNIDALIGKINALEQKLESGKFTVKNNGIPLNMPQLTQKESITEHNITTDIKAVRHIPSPEPVSELEPAARKPETIKPPVLKEDGDGGDPFSSNPFASPVKNVQSAISEISPEIIRNSGEIFARFLRCLRTTHRNAVLFTLCMDLENSFDGNTLVLTTESESVLKALKRDDNAKFITGLLAELGVFVYDVRLKAQGENKYEKALEELKNNFKGTEIDIKEE